MGVRVLSFVAKGKTPQKALEKGVHGLGELLTANEIGADEIVSMSAQTVRDEARKRYVYMVTLIIRTKAADDAQTLLLP